MTYSGAWTAAKIRTKQQFITLTLYMLSYSNVIIIAVTRLEIILLTLLLVSWLSLTCLYLAVILLKPSTIGCGITKDLWHK